ncbi:MAG: hypothetical protein HWE39_12785 [Oceanospirillaceae bacterium]|nr:hypothetical protein [Oceanospirillaceae bacterium]
MKTNNKKQSVNGPLNTYYAHRYLPHNGVEYYPGDEIQLSSKQARFLLLNGFIGKTKQPVKPVKEPAPKKAIAE